MRLLITTFFAGIMLFMFILTARLWGQGQTFNEFNHEYFAGSGPAVILKVQNLVEAQQALKIKKDVIFWIDVRMSSDRVPFVLPKSKDVLFLQEKQKQQAANPTQMILKGGKLNDYPWSETLAFYKEIPLLKDFYAQLPDSRFVVNIIDNSTAINDVVIATIKDFNPNSRTLIQSDTLVVMTSIKDDKPEWVYGTAQADLMRFLTFDSMWILPTTQYKGDVFIAPFEILKRPAFNDDVIAEMRRRHRRVYLGPIASKAQFDDAKRLNADAYITENLPELLSWLDQGPRQ